MKTFENIKRIFTKQPKVLFDNDTSVTNENIAQLLSLALEKSFEFWKEVYKEEFGNTSDISRILTSKVVIVDKYSNNQELDKFTDIFLRGGYNTLFFHTTNHNIYINANAFSKLLKTLKTPTDSLSISLTIFHETVHLIQTNFNINKDNYFQDKYRSREDFGTHEDVADKMTGCFLFYMESLKKTEKADFEKAVSLHYLLGNPNNTGRSSSGHGNPKIRSQNFKFGYELAKSIGITNATKQIIEDMREKFEKSTD